METAFLNIHQSYTVDLPKTRFDLKLLAITVVTERLKFKIKPDHKCLKPNSTSILEPNSTSFLCII